MRRGGFSLVELMVVVGLIGILASVAVPQYQRFQSRARQVEAKLALGAIYNAEKLWFLESGGYTVCLGAIGYEPRLAAPGVAQGYYARGFGGATGAGQVLPPGVSSFGSGCGASWDASKMVSALAPASVGDGALSSTTCCDGGFQAGADGNISSSLGSFDQWSIDHLQALVNFYDAL
ncbi:MAG: type IV pilin protein [Oligoflexia bacterium]